jgi:hypothetical protein
MNEFNSNIITINSFSYNIILENLKKYWYKSCAIIKKN